MKDSHRLTTQNTGTLKKWYFCFCCHLFCSWFQIIPCLYQSLLCLYPGEFSALILLQQAFLLWRLSDRLSYSGEFDVRRFYSSRNNWTLEKLKGIHELKHVYTSHMWHSWCDWINMYYFLFIITHHLKRIVNVWPSCFQHK